MVLSYYYQSPVGKDYYWHIMKDAVIWLSCYGYIFTILSYLTMVNQCLIIFFSPKLCVVGKIFIRRSEKKLKTIKKVNKSKMQTVNPFFWQKIVYT